jgi:DNA mismatch endonuclease (patch repair protein)
MGYRFRLHSKSLPGHPDVVLPRYHTALFVHGCFWHRHRGCEYATTPKTRTHFWTEKFKANAVRDRRVIRELRQLEWHVLVVWECELRDVTALATRLDAKLRLQLDAVGSKL